MKRISSAFLVLLFDICIHTSLHMFKCGNIAVDLNKMMRKLIGGNVEVINLKVYVFQLK
jgi:hypothetical protein